MTKEKVSLISVFVNLLLTISKIGAGFWFRSSALIADGVHSGLDIFSSFLTYLGVRFAQKPADREHPYGHWRYEILSGFLVTILLIFSGLWIVYEGARNFLEGNEVTFSFWAIGVAAFSVVVNELLAQLKLKTGEQTNSLALLADGKHSRADSLSSLGVLGGLILSPWFSRVDALVAFFIGLYIVIEASVFGKEVTDGLLDVSSPSTENKIKEICQKENISLKEIKTRKIGDKVFADLEIGLNNNWKMDKVEEVVKSLEKMLVTQIKELELVVIKVSSHHFKDKLLKNKKNFCSHPKTFTERKFPKKGHRTIIPLKEDKISIYPSFGAPFYLVIDKESDGYLKKEVIKNRYFTLGKSHGYKFVKDLDPDEIITREISQTLFNEFKKQGVKVKITQLNKTNF